VIAGAALALTLVAARDLDRAIGLVREGKFTDALAAATSDPDPARRAQAEFYVRHHAGDLDGALGVAQAARAAGHGSAWLAEREVFVAVTVRDPVRARSALGDYAARPASEREPLAASIAALTAELTRVEAVLAERERAELRARVAIALGALALVAATAAFLAHRATARAT
jgi:hypothetical protein